jgi:ubiquinone/menaquinone biosynthesis C-methylase UbiE
MEAETYDRWYETPRGRWIGQREVALLLGELQPRPGESLLDVGCGTGFFTRALASAIGGPATGVDINPEWGGLVKECVNKIRRQPSPCSASLALR